MKENKNASATIQNFNSLTKIADLCAQEEEMLPENAECFPVLYDKRVKVFKEKDSKHPGESSRKFRFWKNSNFIRVSSNWEYFGDGCSKKIVALFSVLNFYKIFSNQFDFCRCYFGFR